jgi:mannose-1-phosphate guanylyltransferase/mannose-6-phosphate isomerase
MGQGRERLTELDESLGPRSVPPEIVEDQRLWGSQTQLTMNESTAVAFLKVNPGQALSEQSHKLRSELWIVLSGEMDVELDGAVSRLSGYGARVFIPVGAHHRAYGLNAPCIYLEIAYGFYDPEDIVRYKDMYNRAE